MEIKRLFDFLLEQQEQNPLDKAFAHQVDGQWKYFSTDDVISQAKALGKGLLSLGVQKGDMVSIVSYKNRVEWIIVDIATQLIGAVNVPVYPTISPRDYEYIFNEAEVKYCFVGSGDLYDKVASAKNKVDTLQEIFTFDTNATARHWKELHAPGPYDEVDQIARTIKNEELATIIYTSGTTGNPKGVMLSHNNIVSNVNAVTPLIPLAKGQTSLSFLPLCHIFERAVSYAYMKMGVSVHFTGTDNLGGDDGDLRNVKPNFFSTVPRLLEKVYEKIYNKGLALTGAKKKLFFWALSLTEDFEYDKAYSGMAKIKRNIADKLIFSKWREALGGNVVGILTGAAPLPVKMAKVFSAAGIPIREGYGLTETSPAITISRYEKGESRLGTVGQAIEGVTLKIDTSDGTYKPEEGEILITGPNVMMGYYKKPEKTAEVMKMIDGVNWFCTGDIGKIIKNKGKEFLKITDRKKELLRTSSGKYVAPAPIESKFKEDFLVEQMMVVGENKKFVSALIIPSEEALKDWCECESIKWESVTEAIKDEKVIAKFQEIVNEFNPNFSHIEQIKKFTLLNVAWEPIKDDGTDSELTPTMKIKRRVIRKKHEDAIANMYDV